jgi:hypothetical protein
MSRVTSFLYTNDYDDSKVPEFCPKTADSHDHDHDQDMQPTDENPTADLLETMSVNALVYKCADMLGIENLRHLRVSDFYSKQKVHTQWMALMNL